MRPSLTVLLLCGFLASCNPGLSTGPDIYVDFDLIDSPTTELYSFAKPYMDGVYEVVRGAEELGNPVVGRWVRNRWCMYSEKDVIFCVCAGGFMTDTAMIKLRGYERVVRSGSGTRVRFTIAGDDGARELIAAVPPPTVRLLGVTEGGVHIELRRIRDTNPFPFYRLAHRGGGRNSERLGISENSEAMIRYAPLMGATAVEIDVQRTRDGQIIVFHDDSFSPRTVQGTYLLGRVADFDLEQIKSLGKLLNGEPIPTLREILAAVILEPQLSLVWIDTKEAQEVGEVVAIQQEMLAVARSSGRNDLRILLGIPSEDVLNAWKPFHESSDALYELDAQTVLDNAHIQVWAPTWTRDISQVDIDRVHNQQKQVFVWTVDIREGMLDYMTNKKADGILTNYPSLVSALKLSQDSSEQ